MEPALPPVEQSVPGATTDLPVLDPVIYQDRLRWREILLGPTEALPAIDAEADGYCDALTDVIGDISVEKALRLRVLEGPRAEDSILSSALNNYRFDILEAALKEGWQPSGGFIDFALFYLDDASGCFLQRLAEEADPEPREPEGELAEFAQIIHWLRGHNFITDKDIPKWAWPRG